MFEFKESEKWLHVNNQLPAENELCVCTDLKIIQLGVYKDNYFYTQYDLEIFAVVKWIKVL